MACCSRPTNSWAGLVKHSYHITIANLVYACNYNKSMEKFFTLPSTSDFSAFHWTDAKGQSKCIVDLSVYTRNRVFRLPYNMKRGSRVPFRRVGDDSYAEDYNSEFNDEDVDDVLPMVLTQIEYCADTYVVPKEVAGTTVDEPASQKGKRNHSAVDVTDSKGEKVKKAKSTNVDPTDEGVRVALEKLLRDAGDKDSQVQMVQRDSEKDYFYAQVCNGNHGRICLEQPYSCVVHKNNTALLYLTQQDISRYNVCFHCFSMLQDMQHKQTRHTCQKKGGQGVIRSLLCCATGAHPRCCMQPWRRAHDDN